ncbi:ABC transporter domain-containing protein [Bordetella tumbae]|uniref:ABC transporter ATP-binding protein n=1 Tax=Bordetella tumbae TaxID=1649139 RepID=UPI0039F103B2
MDNRQDVAIELSNINKIYHTYQSPKHRLLEILTNGKRRYAKETRALDSVSFMLPKGGRLGIVGENGSGKSTLLKVLAGVLTPSSGSITVNGRVSALLELGAGFNPALPGRENIKQFCMLHGMSSEEIEAATPDIIQFSELRDAVEQPVKTYSSGMAIRLGFACAVYVQPEILIVDEALSVGDAYFQNKCLHKIKSLLDDGVTFIYVTHVADSIRALCDRGVWMDHGKVRMAGSSSEVGAAYQAEVFRRMVHAGLSDEVSTGNDGATQEQQSAVAQSVDHARHRAFEERIAALRTGSGEARILDIAVIGHDGVDTDTVPFNEKTRIRVFYQIDKKLPAECGITLGISDNSGREVVHFNSCSMGVSLDTESMHRPCMMEFEFDNSLCPGEYGLSAGIGSFRKNPNNFGQMLTNHIVDYAAGGARFNVRFPDSDSALDLWGVTYVPFSVENLALD